MLITNSNDYIVLESNILYQKKYDIFYYDTDLLELDNVKKIKVQIVVPDSDNYNNYLIHHQNYLNMALDHNKKGNIDMEILAWERYYKFKNKYLLLNDLTRDGKLIVKKDLDYGYAITVHKSQGSTYDYIFVDEYDINSCKNYILRNKLKYTAFTRPRHILFSVYSYGE